MTELTDKPAAAVAATEAVAGDVAVPSKTTLWPERHEPQLSVPGMIGIVSVTVGAGGSGPEPGTAAGSGGASAALVSGWAVDGNRGALADPADGAGVIDPAGLVSPGDESPPEALPRGELGFGVSEAPVGVGVLELAAVKDTGWTASAMGAARSVSVCGLAACTFTGATAETTAWTGLALSPIGADGGLAIGAAGGETAPGSVLAVGLDELGAGAGRWLLGGEIAAGGAEPPTPCPLGALDGAELSAPWAGVGEADPVTAACELGEATSPGAAAGVAAASDVVVEASVGAGVLGAVALESGAGPVEVEPGAGAATALGPFGIPEPSALLGVTPLESADPAACGVDPLGPDAPAPVGVEPLAPVDALASAPG